VLTPHHPLTLPRRLVRRNVGAPESPSWRCSHADRWCRPRGRFSPFARRRPAMGRGGELLMAERHVAIRLAIEPGPNPAGKHQGGEGVLSWCGPGGAATGVAPGVRRRHHGAETAPAGRTRRRSDHGHGAIAGIDASRLRTRKAGGLGRLPGPAKAENCCDATPEIKECRNLLRFQRESATGGFPPGSSRGGCVPVAALSCRQRCACLPRFQKTRADRRQPCATHRVIRSRPRSSTPTAPRTTRSLINSDAVVGTVRPAISTDLVDAGKSP